MSCSPATPFWMLGIGLDSMLHLSLRGQHRMQRCQWKGHSSFSRAVGPPQELCGLYFVDFHAQLQKTLLETALACTAFRSIAFAEVKKAHEQMCMHHLHGMQCCCRDDISSKSVCTDPSCQIALTAKPSCAYVASSGLLQRQGTACREAPGCNLLVSEKKVFLRTCHAPWPPISPVPCTFPASGQVLLTWQELVTIVFHNPGTSHSASAQHAYMLPEGHFARHRCHP